MSKSGFMAQSQPPHGRRGVRIAYVLYARHGPRRVGFNPHVESECVYAEL